MNKLLCMPIFKILQQVAHIITAELQTVNDTVLPAAASSTE
jgi:hypothetical protein